jgi:hypothetical protein
MAEAASSPRNKQGEPFDKKAPLGISTKQGFFIAISAKE